MLKQTSQLSSNSNDSEQLAVHSRHGLGGQTAAPSVMRQRWDDRVTHDPTTFLLPGQLLPLPCRAARVSELHQGPSRAAVALQSGPVHQFEDNVSVPIALWDVASLITEGWCFLQAGATAL